MSNRKIKKRPMNESAILLVSVLIMFIGGTVMSYLADYLQKNKALKEPLATPEQREYAKKIIGDAILKAFRDIADRKPGGATQAAMESLKSDVFLQIDSGRLKTFKEVLKYFEQAIRRANS